ncbi:AraC family transcriptional regulator [Sinorhizobium numidicum]|uniref:AraC family transcriptional regulator n=1 Tax=Sinorhizobium numidicum TaxID=680248 RepID=A0ABY8CNX8_9HYPH|nr:AraC family transcriptional regulator [Sinorhizobium numidicum]WEX73882.1 AraC family transcriptional regulator [Sinorhizobium numidicum]WEX79867.1 AraC family transcriptional regulator [Sinorhizobium numidicum]
MRYVTRRSKFSIVEADADQMSEHYAKTLSPAKVEPLRLGDRISVEDKHYAAGRFSIWSGKCHSGMKVAFSERPDAYAFYLPVSGAMEIAAGRTQLLSTPGTGVVGDISRFEKLTLHADRSHIGVAFDKAAMVSHLSELLDFPVLDRIDLFTTIGTNSGIGARVASVATFLWNCLEAEDGDNVPPAAIERLFEAMVIMILESVPHNYTSRLKRSASPAMPRNLKRAIEYMVAHMSQPLTVSDIAREAGTSVRSLQTAFQQFKETTPLTYLRQMRLDGVRKALSDGANSLPIAEVARNWGFSHLGRFSAVYYNAFGETPSETVKLHCGKAGSTTRRRTEN